MLFDLKDILQSECVWLISLYYIQVKDFWQEHYISDVVSFPLYSIKSHICPIIGNAEGDHLIKGMSAIFLIVKLLCSFVINK